MTRPPLHRQYDIPWETPDQHEGINLYHVRDLSRLEDDPRFSIGSATHRVTTLCLWLWGKNSSQTEPTEYPKDEFLRAVCPEEYLERGIITKSYVGKVLSYSLRYSPRFQRIRQGKSTMCWRIRHPAEVRYGMEHHVAMWYAQFCARVAKTHEKELEVGEEELRSFFTEEMREADVKYVAEFFGRQSEM